MKDIDIENLNEQDILNIFDDVIAAYGPQSALPHIYSSGSTTNWYSDCPSDGSCQAYYCYADCCGSFRNGRHWAGGCWCAYKRDYSNSYWCGR